MSAATDLRPEDLPRIGPKEAFDSHLRRIVTDARRAGIRSASVITDQILGEFTPEQCRRALAVLLPKWVMDEIGAQDQLERASVIREAHPRPTTADRVRSWYEQQMAMPMYVGGKEKPFARCTPDDLDDVAAFRFQQATYLNKQASLLAAIAEFMRDHQLTRAGEVREGDLRKLMGASS